MASEPTKEGGVTVELSPGLDEWLDEQSRALGLTREAVVRQLLASYRTTADIDDDELFSALGDVETAVEDAMQDELDAAVAAAVDSRLQTQIRPVEEEFQEKIEDVRKRVIQIKRETDQKAPADHDHDTFEELDERLEALSDDLQATQRQFEDDIDEQAAHIDELREQFDEMASRLDDVEDKLKRVAWVVSDLRKDNGGRNSRQKSVDRLKRAAAQEGISEASCENCSESVDVALLTEPQCPHCGSTVSDVRPTGGIFRKKAKLVTAAQLEAGPTDE